jgi:predicted transcriptional regulator
LYGANLSHDRLVKHLEELKSLGVVGEVTDQDARFYSLTHRGIEFLNQFRAVDRFAAAFGFVI